MNASIIAPVRRSYSIFEDECGMLHMFVWSSLPHMGRLIYANTVRPEYVMDRLNHIMEAETWPENNVLLALHVDSPRTRHVYMDRTTASRYGYLKHIYRRPDVRLIADEDGTYPHAMRSNEVRQAFKSTY